MPFYLNIFIDVLGLVRTHLLEAEMLRKERYNETIECPHCRVHFNDGVFSDELVDIKLFHVACTACGRSVIFVATAFENKDFRVMQPDDSRKRVWNDKEMIYLRYF